MLIVLDDNLSGNSTIINPEKIKYAYIVYEDKLRCVFEGGGWLELSLKDGERLCKQIKEENARKIRETEARIKYFSERQQKDIQI